MIRLALPCLLALVAMPLLSALGAPSDADEERAAVRRAVLDYVEGVYEMRPELIERGVHPDLAKFGFWRPSSDAPYQGGAMNFGQLVELSKNYNAEGRIPEDAPKEVEVLDLLDQTASVKLTASWGIDYMHLAKFEGEWKILQVLWQVHPEAAGQD